MKPVIKITHFGVEVIRSVSDELQHKAYHADIVYRQCELNAKRGEIVLITGPSGAGKSLLTEFILGRISPVTPQFVINRGDQTVTPVIELNLDGLPSINLLTQDAHQQLTGRVGMMYQSLGLFEDLTVEQNLRFANDHSRRPRQGQALASWLDQTLIQLRLTSTLRSEAVHSLSGGQRQRLALGRLLAYDPDVMIFDEPTSALDEQNALEMAQLIHTSHVSHSCALTLIITHDLELFLPLADRVWFLSPDRNFYDHAPPLGLEEYKIQSKRRPIISTRVLSEQEVLREVALSVDDLFNPRGASALQNIRSGFRSLLSPWVLFYFKRFINRVFLSAIVFHLSAAFVLGAVATYFTLNMEMGTLQFSEVGPLDVQKILIPSLLEQLLSGFGRVSFKAIIPIFTCLCIAARSGTGITAYLCELKDRNQRQWDAMECFGIQPLYFFIPQLLITFALSCSILSYLSFWSASLGSLCVSLLTHPLCHFYTWYDSYWAGLHPRSGIWFSGMGYFLAKTLLSGLAIGCTCIWFGTRERSTSLETLKRLSSANVVSVFCILLIFSFFLVMERSG